MLYLGEVFDSRNCFKTCDNCKVNYGLIYEDVRDYTACAKAVVELLQVVGDIRSIRNLPYNVSNEVMESLEHAQAVGLLQTLTAIEMRTLARKLFSARILRYNGTKKSYTLALDINHFDLMRNQLQVKFQQPVVEPPSTPSPTDTELPAKRTASPSPFQSLT